uniref:Lymphocyte cytosolic protein 2 n=1 Tax=Nannospalax galili TaxID=1026970 RepID=A0A8C6QLS2_NANGA
MALRNVPFRSEVLAWNPDNLADYFKKLNYRDCEKAVKKYHIDGARFLNLTENDIQKFPKLRVPILSKLSQDINKNEERRSIFTRKPQVQRFPEETDDDYESPNDDDPDGEDDGDYESPNEEDEALVEDAADYEPPPSNDEEALQNSILPAKPFPNTNSMYIGKASSQPAGPGSPWTSYRPPTGKVSQQPPVPPQRPMAALPPLPTSRNHSPTHPISMPPPSIDRSTKPSLDRSLAPLDREPFTLVKVVSYTSFLPSPNRTLGEHLPKIQKLPLPPAMDRHERSSPLPGKKPPVPKHGWGPDRRENVIHQRPLPQPAPLSMSSNTFPSRSAKPSPKHMFPSSHMPGAFSESNSGFQQSASLPPVFSQGPSNRSPLRAEGRNLPLPIPNRPQPPSPGEEEHPLDEEWYISYITRPEAEAALRKINQDGTFLVRDSSKKTVSNPYVLMVLYKDKVYNIQIRYQEESQVYLLGTGLRGKEDFLSVSDIIDYFRKMPLLLIDGKNRGSRYQCTLTHAAGCP